MCRIFNFKHNLDMLEMKSIYPTKGRNDFTTFICFKREIISP